MCLYSWKSKIFQQDQIKIWTLEKLMSSKKKPAFVVRRPVPVLDRCASHSLSLDLDVIIWKREREYTACHIVLWPAGTSWFSYACFILWYLSSVKCNIFFCFFLRGISQFLIHREFPPFSHRTASDKTVILPKISKILRGKRDQTMLEYH